MVGPVTARSSARVLMCAFAVTVLSATETFAAPMSMTSPDHLSAVPDARAEPFGLDGRFVSDGAIAEKWRKVKIAIDAELQVLSSCRDDRLHCEKPEALRFIAIIEAAQTKSGLARIGEINRAINLAIRPVSDMVQYGVEDYWASPLALLKAGAGDCEDYAIAKFVALREAGMAAVDMRLVILRDPITGEDHAVAAARTDGEWRILDNRYLAMVVDSDLDQRAPLFAINEDGVKLYSDAPVLVADTVQQPASDSASVGDPFAPSAIAADANEPAADVIMTQAP